jgi:hypothetical protein
MSHTGHDFEIHGVATSGKCPFFFFFFFFLPVFGP